MKIVPRKWQQRAIGVCRTIALDGADRALVYACPGSGKTYGGLFIAKDLAERAKKGPKIIVLTPNLAIKSQWIKRAAELGLKLLPVQSGEDLRQDHLSIEEVGFILSYQQAVNMRHSLRQYCDTNKPIVILDEVHHTEGPRADKDGNAWGHAVELACASASFKLCTTGTPFREGNNPISFVRYNDDQSAVAHITYTYEDAIRDGVCRPIEFEMFDGSISWMDQGERVTATFQDKLTKKRERQRLRAALSTDGDHPRSLLAAAHERLLELREGDDEADRRAAGLVVAVDVQHANEIAEELAAVSGQRPTVVHNEIDNAQRQIDDFRDSDAMWIVGINMLSEGVDIPRLRVGVYASNIRAALYFNQFCGRFARVMKDRNERSFVFMPADPELEAIALTIEQYRAHALGEEFTGRLRRTGVSNGYKKSLKVIDSDGEAKFLGFNGKKYPTEYVTGHRPKIRDFRLKDPSRMHMSDGEVLSIMIDLGVIPPPVGDAA